MLIYAVDDEPPALRTLVRAIREAEPDCQIREFSWGQPMLDAMTDSREKPDAVFLDVEMPEENGIEVARRVKRCSPRTWIVFVTGFSEYALDAFSVHAKGYIIKPVTAQDVRAELSDPALPPLPRAKVARAQIQTFGNFEVFVGGTPLAFSRGKAKEMLAYLVHRNGAACTTRELAAVLFEGDANGKMDYFFKVAQCLRQTLKNAGCGDIVRHSYRSYALETSLVDCDYYRFLQGTDAAALNAYTGEYMAQYSWAEQTDFYLREKS